MLWCPGLGQCSRRRFIYEATMEHAGRSTQGAGCSRQSALESRVRFMERGTGTGALSKRTACTSIPSVERLRGQGTITRAQQTPRSPISHPLLAARCPRAETSPVLAPHQRLCCESAGPTVCPPGHCKVLRAHPWGLDPCRASDSPADVMASAHSLWLIAPRGRTALFLGRVWNVLKNCANNNATLPPGCVGCSISILARWTGTGARRRLRLDCTRIPDAGTGRSGPQARQPVRRPT